MSSLIILASLFAVVAADGHLERNPLYARLLNQGIAMAGGEQRKLPPPSMPDGLNAAEQRKVIEQIAGQDYSVENLIRKSIVTPYILRINEPPATNPKLPPKTVDVWFIAHGNLDDAANKDFLDRLREERREEGDYQALEGPVLAKRNIAIPPDRKDREAYGYAELPILEKVQLRAASHSIWSRTKESIVLASLVDPRFTEDRQFPNQWQPLVRNGSGKLVPGGQVHPYQGSGYYLKITRLNEPKGALFVETHIAFVEPVGWFRGANLLRSKLPPIVQSQVRSIRRELLKAGRR